MASRALKLRPTSTASKELNPDPIDLRAMEIVNRHAIAVRAYERWLERGSPVGSDQEDWFNAENELKHRTA